MKPFLHSNRLTLCDFKEGDGPLIQKIAESEFFHFVRLDPTDVHTGNRFVSFCIDESKLELEGQAGQRVNYRLAIYKRKTQNLIGYVGLFNFDFNKKDAEIGYFISPLDWGEGYAEEAVDLIVAYVRELLGLESIWATVREDNIASMNVLKKLGMKQDGCIVNKYDDVKERLIFRRALLD